ncbi:MAG: hypothetical protein J1F04_02800 [Oscillospiraceae bacterium]|nr:hypothetical protein [Oscillospiraceae bacterium]MCH5207790.1 hypothetical protein [Oscillospiraceae bacterium]
MACFIVPVTEAVITTVASKVIRSREIEMSQLHGDDADIETEYKLPLSRKLRWLNNMLWGGSALLVFEHIWHGELSAVFPFLTAMSDPVEMAEMFNEMATAGVAMSAVVTAVWAGMVAVASSIEKRREKRSES